MILSTRNADVLQIRLIPNCSMTWRQTRGVILALGGLSLAIALFWTFQGAWVILPFAGLEVGLLAYLTYQVCLETYHQQVLYVFEDRIEIEWGKNFPKKRWVFENEKSELVVTHPRHSLSPPELSLSDGARQVVLGERLDRDDKQNLIDQLKKSGLKYRSQGKTTTKAIDGFDLS